MPRIVRLPSLLILLTAACGGDAGSAPPDADAGSETAQAAVADSPRVITGVTAADTLESMAPMICADGLQLQTTYWTGINPRVVLGTPDTVLVLKRTGPAAEARYQNAAPPMEWVHRGETATLTRGGKTVTCELAEAGEVDF